MKFKLKSKEHVAGNRFIDSNSNQVVEIIEKVYSNYKVFGNIEDEDFKDKKILEIGPGDSFGIAIKLLFSNAKEIVCFDKFYAKRNGNLLKEAYLKMFKNKNTYSFKDIFNEDLLPQNKIHYFFGKGIEKIKFDNNFFEKESYNYIFSNQVIQEIYNPFPAFHKMIKLLKSGGKMVHHIDFEPYNYFRHHLKKEYDYLTFTEIEYKWMVNKRGMGNRKRITEYIDYLNKNKNIDYKFIVSTCFLDKEKLEAPIEYPNFPENIKKSYKTLVESQKSNFNKKYKNLPIEDLMVGNAYLVIEKK